MRIRVWYEKPYPRVVDLDPPEDLGDDELVAWIVDNVPIADAYMQDWEYE